MNKMNNKAQSNSLYFSIIVGIMLFLCGMILLNFIKPSIIDARTNLDCTNSSITDGTKLTCLVVDSVMPYIILLIISLAGGYITEKFIV
jgi:hypothetical protein